MFINDFNGFLKYKDNIFSFSFSKNEITIFSDFAKKENELLKTYFSHSHISKNKWLNKIIIDGIIDKNTGVKFFTTDSPLY